MDEADSGNLVRSERLLSGSRSYDTKRDQLHSELERMRSETRTQHSSEDHDGRLAAIVNVNTGQISRMLLVQVELSLRFAIKGKLQLHFWTSLNQAVLAGP